MSKLQEILRKKNVTQKRLAELTGVHETHISNFIAGRNDITLKKAKLIADVIEVKIDDLI